jgi:hypothetical protein
LEKKVLVPSRDIIPRLFSSPSVVGKIMAPKMSMSQSLEPVNEYVTSHGKRDYTDVIMDV